MFIIFAIILILLLLKQISTRVGGGVPSSQPPADQSEGEFVGEWARLWVHVIRQFRDSNITLKKVEKGRNSSTDLEYELSPFEQLLADIRLKRYKLREVMIGADLPPRERKDAHALILEFIRSKPTLLPVSERVLPVRESEPKAESLYERLMKEIRESKLELKPISRQLSHSQNSLTTGHSLLDHQTRPASAQNSPQKRRLIKADLNLKLSDYSFSDDQSCDHQSIDRLE